MLEFDLTKMTNQDFKKGFDRLVKEKYATTRETIFQYTKKLVEKKHNNEYEIVQTVEKNKTIVAPEKGMEPRARSLEFGTAEQKPIIVWRMVFKKLMALTRKDEPTLNLRKHFGRVVKGKADNKL